jgi:molecular chaperone GrpE (heat shock protein)
VAQMKKKIHTLLSGKASPASQSPSGAQTKINASLGEARQQLWDLKGKVQSIDQQFSAIQALWGQAWNEREQLKNEYYQLLGAVLETLDTLEENPEALPSAAVGERLKQILLRQGVEKGSTRPGDPFQPEEHEVEDTAFQEGMPHGAILEVISPCYARVYANGERLVIRPARVIVNRVGKTSGSQNNKIEEEA